MTNLSSLLLEKQMKALVSKEEIFKIMDSHKISDAEFKLALLEKELVSYEDNFFRLSYKISQTGFDGWLASNKLYAPSYVSGVSALHNAEFIPDVVWGVACCTTLPSKKILSTDNVFFVYDYVPQKNIFAGVKEKYGWGCNEKHLEAIPLKALADYIYIMKLDWTTLHPLRESLRIEDEELETITSEDFDCLEGNYYAENVNNFLHGIRQELGV